MLKLKKGAVTGGLSCGKSSVCHFLKELGAYVVSADEIVHQLLSPKTSIGQQVINLIGTDILIEGRLNRKKIANKVFNQPTLLKSLESILHPAVKIEMEKQYEFMKAHNLASLFIAEIPLLFESKSDTLFDFIICVTAEKKICQKRFMESTQSTPEEYEKRNQLQFDIGEKAKHSTYVINNNGSLAELKETVTKLYQELTK